jgi:hypothetical protein
MRSVTFGDSGADRPLDPLPRTVTALTFVLED